MTPREERIATLGVKRRYAEDQIRHHFEYRRRDRGYDHGGVVRREIAWCRILDAKIASLRGAL